MFFLFLRLALFSFVCVTPLESPIFFFKHPRSPGVITHLLFVSKKSMYFTRTFRKLVHCCRLTFLVIPSHFFWETFYAPSPAFGFPRRLFFRPPYSFSLGRRIRSVFSIVFRTAHAPFLDPGPPYLIYPLSHLLGTFLPAGGLSSSNPSSEQGLLSIHTLYRNFFGLILSPASCAVISRWARRDRQSFLPFPKFHLWNNGPFFFCAPQFTRYYQPFPLYLPLDAHASSL